MNMKKVLTVILIMSTSLFIMTSCGGGDEKKSSFPTDPLEIVTYGINDSMSVIKEEASDSMLNLSSYMGLEESDLEKPEVNINFDIKNDEGDVSIFYKALNNTKSKDATLALGLSADGQNMQTSVNFTGDDMIMSFLSTSEPMVKYSMPSDKTNSISDLDPLSRYVAALELEPAEESKDTWDADLSKFTDGLSTNLTSENVEKTTEAITHKGEEIEASTYTLTAADAAASEALKDLFNALNSDEDMNSLTTASEQADEDSVEALASVESVINDEAKLAETKLTSKVYVDNETILACNMTFETPDGNFIINNQYAIDKNSKDITTKTVYISGLEMTSTHVLTTDGDTENEKQTYVMSQANPKGTLELINESKAVKAGDDYTKDFTISYTSDEEGVITTANSTGKYEATNSEGTVNGTFSGTADSNDPTEGKQTFNYSGTTLMSDKDPEVTIPTFLADSGKEFTDVNELKAYLNEDSGNKIKNITNPYERKITAMIWMIRLNF